MTRVFGVALAAKHYEHWLSAMYPGTYTEENLKEVAKSALAAAAIFIAEAGRYDYETALPAHPGIPVTDDGIPSDELASTAP